MLQPFQPWLTNQLQDFKGWFLNQPFQMDVHFSGGKLQLPFVVSIFLSDLFPLVFSAHRHWLNKASLGELALFSDCNSPFYIHGLFYCLLQFLKKNLAEFGVGKGNLKCSLLVFPTKYCKKLDSKTSCKLKCFEKSLEPLLTVGWVDVLQEQQLLYNKPVNMSCVINMSLYCRNIYGPDRSGQKSHPSLHTRTHIYVSRPWRLRGCTKIEPPKGPAEITLPLLSRSTHHKAGGR